MYLQTSSPVGEFTSPFGSRMLIPPGMVTEVSVEQGYWLVGHPEITVEYIDAAEQAKCEAVVILANKNPLRGVPQPQYLTPNATLLLDGHSTRYPVIVVNPQGLVSEYQGTYEFGKPELNLVFDREMIREVFKEFQAAMRGGTDDVDLPTEAGSPVAPVTEVTAPPKTPEITPVDGETKVTEIAPPVTEVSSEAVAPGTIPGGEEASDTGKGRGRKTISDEDI